MSDERNTTQELIRAFRQLRHINWSGKRPIEGCTPSETMMLFVIRRCTADTPEGMKASDLSQFLRVTSPTVTQQVNVLEARGLLARAADPSDRRVVRIKLTEEGMRLTKIAEQKMHEGVQTLIDYMSEERAQLLIGLLDEVFRFYSDKESLHDTICRKPDFKPNE